MLLFTALSRIAGANGQRGVLWLMPLALCPGVQAHPSKSPLNLVAHQHGPWLFVEFKGLWSHWTWNSSRKSGSLATQVPHAVDAKPKVLLVLSGLYISCSDAGNSLFVLPREGLPEDPRKLFQLCVDLEVTAESCFMLALCVFWGAGGERCGWRYLAAKDTTIDSATPTRHCGGALGFCTASCFWSCLFVRARGRSPFPVRGSAFASLDSGHENFQRHVFLRKISEDG